MRSGVYLLDGGSELVNLNDTLNGLLRAQGKTFHQSHYVLLNLALGGNAGEVDDLVFPTSI